MQVFTSLSNRSSKPTLTATQTRYHRVSSLETRAGEFTLPQWLADNLESGAGSPLPWVRPKQCKPETIPHPFTFPVIFVSGRGIYRCYAWGPSANQPLLRFP